MKTTKLFFLFAIILFAFQSCILNREIKDQSAGMNGGFEIVRNQLPVNWYFTRYKETIEQNDRSINDFDIISDTIDIKEGNRALKFVIRKCSNKGMFQSPGLFQEFEVKSGATYRMSFWVKNNGTNFKIDIAAITLKGDSKEPNEVKSISSKEDITEWKQYVVQKHIPSDLDRIRIDLTLLSPGVFQIDDVQLKEIMSNESK
jgi:hypothetical protein